MAQRRLALGSRHFRFALRRTIAGLLYPRGGDGEQWAQLLLTDSLGVSVDGTGAVAGAEATGAIGSVAASGDAAAVVDGEEATGAAGAVSASGGGVGAADGVEATGAVGTISATGGGRGVVAGVSATGQVGSVECSPAEAPPAEEVAAGGTPAKYRKNPRTTHNEPYEDYIVRFGGGNIAGVEAVAAVGHIGFSAGATMALAGVGASGVVGSIGARGIHNPDEDIVAVLLAAA